MKKILSAGMIAFATLAGCQSPSGRDSGAGEVASTKSPDVRVPVVSVQLPVVANCLPPHSLIGMVNLQ